MIFIEKFPCFECGNFFIYYSFSLKIAFFYQKKRPYLTVAIIAFSNLIQHHHKEKLDISKCSSCVKKYKKTGVN
jgi:hypothetical protein